MASEQDQLDLHAIQLKTIEIIQLHLRVYDRASAASAPVSLGVAPGEYDSEAHTITVAVKADIGMVKGEDMPKLPFQIRVELAGQFHVDEGKFPIEHIDNWAQDAAMYVLYPFLREHIYGLTLRAGLPLTILPMVEVPVFSLQKDGPEPE